LTSSAHNAENSRHLPPASAALARQLLVAEAGQNTSPEALAAAGERIYLQLRARLAVLLGATGFDALWARALHLAQPTFRSGDDTAEADALPSSASGLHAAVRGRTAAAVQHNLEAALASVITLLFTFIGEELGFRFIRQIWTDLPPDAAASRAEEATA
jgi:hypothetical protein